MARPIAGQIEKTAVKNLTMNARSRRASNKARHATSFKEALLAMPNIGSDADFERGPRLGRPVGL